MNRSSSRRTVIAALGLFIAALVVVPGTRAAAESQTFFNTTPITFAGTTSGSGSLYPSTIQVTALEGPITDVDVTVNAVDMEDLHYLQLLLVSPSGEAEIVKTQGCWGATSDSHQLTFDQDAPTIGVCHDGDPGRPFNYCSESPCAFFDSFAGAGTANFDNFNGENANGTWRLYAYRDCHEDHGPCPSTGDEIAAGWSLSIDTGPIDVDLPAGSATNGPASPYPASRLVTSATGQLVTDVNVRLEGVWHTHPDDLEIMLEKVGGPRVMLMSDACGGFDATAYMWVWDDEAAAHMPDEGPGNVCATTVQRPTDHAPGDSLPSPAPAAPYGTSLAAFDLLEANGEWRMWIADDATGDEGFLTKRFTLEMTTRPRASTSLDKQRFAVSEGTTGSLTVRRTGANAYAPGTVTVRTVPGTATAGDFTPITTVLDFASGETVKHVEIAVAADATDEDEETFTVQLSDPTGDVSPGPTAIATVVIPADDRAAPQTRLLKGPRSGFRRKATVRFASSEPGTFRCKVDRKAWKPCSSPLRLKNLRFGKHTVLVVATDRAGNADPTPLKVVWRVKRRR